MSYPPEKLYKKTMLVIGTLRRLKGCRKTLQEIHRYRKNCKGVKKMHVVCGKKK